MRNFICTTFALFVLTGINAQTQQAQAASSSRDAVLSTGSVPAAATDSVKAATAASDKSAAISNTSALPATAPSGNSEKANNKKESPK